MVYDLPDEVVPSRSPIRSSRSAKSNNSCWICAICVCRASCLIFSAIARSSSPLPSRSFLIGVSRPKAIPGGAGRFDPFTDRNGRESSRSPKILVNFTVLNGCFVRRDAAQCRGGLTTLMQCLLSIAQQKRKNTMGEPQGTGTQSGGQHYREIASKLREIARECRFPGARREILDLATRLNAEPTT